MKTRLITLLSVVALTSGCLHRWQKTETVDSAASNAAVYDSFVTRKTELLAAGGKYSRAEANAMAQAEATRLFGARSDGSASRYRTTWQSSASNRDLTLAELDQTMAGMKKR